MTKRIFLFSIYLLLTSIVAVQAQQKTITGIVNDNTGEPIIGANVLLQGGDAGTITYI